MLEQSGLVGVVMNEPIQKKVTLRRRAPEKVSSKQLLGETKKLFIQHAGSEYTLGRNVDEMLRLVDALQFSEEHGEVCPAGWEKGDSGMKATTEGVAEYLAENSAKL